MRLGRIIPAKHPNSFLCELEVAQVREMVVGVVVNFTRIESNDQLCSIYASFFESIGHEIASTMAVPWESNDPLCSIYASFFETICT